jgi:type I restriction enzyme S subunit
MPFFQGIAADKATTMGHIKREHLAQAKIVIPSDGNIVAIADKLIAPIYERIHANERESSILAGIREALLPKLLSGELRILQAKKMMGEVA